MLHHILKPDWDFLWSLLAGFHTFMMKGPLMKRTNFHEKEQLILGLSFRGPVVPARRLTFAVTALLLTNRTIG